jgi:glycosyltransferase involved in cell wall biosynthesis
VKQVCILKPKILFITDDIRMPSGVGIQSKKFITGLQKTGKYEIVCIAGSVTPQNPQPFLYENIKMYPTADGYGNPNLVRMVISVEKPDIVVAFSDPRFFSYLFFMDDEIRLNSKFIFYHTWDNEPFPKFNLPWYASCDEVVMLSKFSYDLMTANGIDCHYIPHGMDSGEFFPVPPDVRRAERENLAAQAGVRDRVEFIIFWNNRNINRKRPGDVVNVFREFSKKHPKVMLVMNTVPIDREGTDLIAVTQEVNKTEAPIVFNFQRLASDRLNVLYNAADVTINIAYNEGFGLCVAESLMAGTPVIATRTGGMTAQMTDGKDTFGWLLDSVARELFGVPGAAYIFRDYVSEEQVLNALEEAYELKKEGNLREIGLKGREYIQKTYPIENTVKLWDDLLEETLAKPSLFKRWRLSIH